jgi:DNA-binding NarL/FixJ family response regulator
MLAEDHRVLREGLVLLLQAEGDIEVVAEAEEGRQAVALALEARPDVVLMDIALVGMDGIEATREICATAPTVAVLILSAHAQLHLVRAALDAGALGYVLKRAEGQALRDAVRAGARGQPYFSNEVFLAVRERARPGRRRQEDAASDNPRATLTGREYEVLQMIASGFSNREIAEALQLSIKTVETHRTNLMGKLEIRDVAGLTRYAIRKGIIET